MSFRDAAAVAWDQRDACALCGRDGGFEDGWLGPLTGPWGTASSGKSYHVHRLCALWSPEVRASSDLVLLPGLL
jgi:hypothetical protein